MRHSLPAEPLSEKEKKKKLYLHALDELGDVD